MPPLSNAERQARFRAKRREERARAREEELARHRGPALVHGDLADAIAAWAIRRLRVPVGLRAGQPFTLLPFQVDFLRAALAPGVRSAGLSTARKNGKSGLIAALLMAALLDDGPLHRALWRGLAVSLNARLSSELWTQVREIAAASAITGLTFHGGHHRAIIGANEARCEFLATGRSVGHASGANVCVFDELGLTEERDRPLLDGLRTAVSGREDGRLIAISVRGRSPLLAEMEERARAGDRGAVFHMFAAPDGAALDDPRTWARANPALGVLKERAYMENAAREAKAVPGSAPGFRSLDLNMSVEPSEIPLLDLDTWKGCVVAPDDLPDREGTAVVGIDLGATQSMTAAAVFFPESGRFEVSGLFPGIPDLDRRAEYDGVGDLYRAMERRGELTVIPGCRVPPVSDWLTGIFDSLLGDGVRLAAVLADRFRQGEVRDVLSGVPGIRQVRVLFRGTGAHSRAHGTADVRAFQHEAAEARIKCLDSLLMAAALRDSRLRFDEAGNPALHRGPRRGRIDAVQAAVLAVGFGRSMRLQGHSGPVRYHGAARGAGEVRA